MSSLALVYQDDEFRQDMREEGRDPQAYLSEAVKESLASYQELYAILQSFPDRPSWVAGDLAVMKAASVREIQDSTPCPAPAPPQPELEEETRVPRNPTLSWKERCLKAEEKCRILEAKLAQVEKDYRALRRAVGARTGSDSATPPDAERRASGDR